MIALDFAGLGDPPDVPMPPGPSSPSLSLDVYDPRLGGSLVMVADIEAALNGGSAPVAGPALGEDALGDPPPIFAPAGGAETIRVSDAGWRGPLPYPPLLVSGPDIECRVALDPAASGSMSWGMLRLAAPGLISGASLEGRDTAQRRVRIRAGLRNYDGARGYVTDPRLSAMLDVFNGLAGPWQPLDNGAQVPLRDASAWLDAPIGTRKFLGTGGAEGPASLAGTPWPIVRGGTLSNPVWSCPVTLVSAAQRIYRWTDTGSLVDVLEDGAAVYTNAGAVADVFATAPSAGQFNYDATGQFRLGSDPQGTVTVNGWSGPSNAATILRNLIMTTLGLPAGLFDEGSAATLAAAAPYVSGWAWTGEETGMRAIQPLLTALGAPLVSSRTGGLRLWGLRALPSNARAVVDLTPDNCEAVQPITLSAPLSPPPADWSVGWAKTHTIITTPKATVTAAERERLAQTWRTARWFEASNLTRYAQPSRPPLLETALLEQAGAQAIADGLGFLWGLPRSLWQVTLPTSAALLRDVGEVVSLRWPADGLRAGVLGQVVGYSLRAGQPSASLLILV